MRALAAAAGRVVVVVSDEPETDADLRQPGEAADAYFARVMKNQGEQLARGSRGVAGNHVVIEHADGEFSVYAHLKKASLKVKVGDAVTAGQTIGQLGTSGKLNRAAPAFSSLRSARSAVVRGHPGRLCQRGGAGGADAAAASNGRCRVGWELITVRHRPTLLCACS